MNTYEEQGFHLATATRLQLAFGKGGKVFGKGGQTFRADGTNHRLASAGDFDETGIGQFMKVMRDGGRDFVRAGYVAADFTCG